MNVSANIDDVIKAGEALTTCSGLMACGLGFLNHYAAALGVVLTVVFGVSTQLTNWYWKSKAYKNSLKGSP